MVYTLFEVAMGFFFRKSASFGPFRVNASKSGLGGSFGIKGARLTMTPRGATYITVGTGGCYYRQTLTNGGEKHRSERGPIPSAEDPIASAGSSDLVDSSREVLIQQLNDRARTYDSVLTTVLAIYVAAVISFLVFLTLPGVPPIPDLPPLASDSKVVDEYAELNARYGEPSSVSISPISSTTPVPVATVDYAAANLKAVFVPNGCVSLYTKVNSIWVGRTKDSPAGLQEIRQLTAVQDSVEPG